jgi:hypothetical protein
MDIHKAIEILKDHQRFVNGESTIPPKPSLVNLAINRIIRYYEEVINPNRVV